MTAARRLLLAAALAVLATGQNACTLLVAGGAGAGAGYAASEANENGDGDPEDDEDEDEDNHSG